MRCACIAGGDADPPQRRCVVALRIGVMPATGAILTRRSCVTMHVCKHIPSSRR
jgi:hypothetical protein